MNPIWTAETITRISTAVVTGIATPALVGLASVRWIKGIRRELRPWRNGVGLASIIIISALWLFQTTRWLLLLINRDLTVSVRRNSCLVADAGKRPEWTALTSGMGHFSFQMVTVNIPRQSRGL